MTNLQNVLIRCYWAERFTSPHGRRPPVKFFETARVAGLIEWRNGYRLTDTGMARIKADFGDNVPESTS